MKYQVITVEIRADDAEQLQKELERYYNDAWRLVFMQQQARVVPGVTDMSGKPRLDLYFLCVLERVLSVPV